MKKSILVIAVILMGTTYVSAQEYVNFGVKGGVNFSSFSGDGYDAFNDPEGRTSFNLGLLAEIPLSARFSLQPEVLYSGQGFDIKSRDADNLEYKLDYINVPVLAKFYIIQGLSIEAGPQIGFLVNKEVEIPGGDVDLPDDAFNDIDFSIGLGASYKFNNFFVSGRYNFGLTDVYDVSGFDAKNSVFQAGVGFMF